MLAVLACFVGLFFVMWLPPLFGFDGWLWLYPVFLLAWLPIEILATLVLVSAARAALTSTDARRTDILTGLLAGTVAVLSLPLLWFGGVV
jgi:hypothetical protein